MPDGQDFTARPNQAPRKPGRPRTMPLTADLDTSIGDIEVRAAICAQTCGSYGAAGEMPRWHCVETHRGAEYQVLRELTKQKFQTYLPLFVRHARSQAVGATPVQKIDARHVTARPLKAPVIRPVFPGYLFVRFDRDAVQWRPIVGTPGVRRLISYSAERPIPIPDAIVEGLQMQGRAGDGVIDSSVRPDPNWQGAVLAEGAELRIKDGPFAAFHGICQWSTTRRVSALMQVFGQESVVVLRRDQVEAVR